MPIIDEPGSDLPRSHGWYAWYNKMPLADDGILRVAGWVVTPTGGYTGSLEPTIEGPYDDPALIALKLELVAPDVGPEVVTEFVVEWQAREPRISVVRIHALGRTVYVPVEYVF